MNLIFIIYTFSNILLSAGKCDIGTEYIGEIIDLNKYSTTCDACLEYKMVGSQISCNFEAKVPCDNVNILIGYLNDGKTCQIQSDLNVFGNDDFTSSVFYDKYPLNSKVNICVDKNGLCKFAPTPSPKPKSKNKISSFYFWK